MAKYKFACVKCSNIDIKYANVTKIKDTCSKCGEQSNRSIPSVSKANVTELIDHYSGINLSPDYKENIDQRSLDHFWSVDVKRLCGEYPPQECLMNGWAFINEKGEFTIHNKPPNRR